MKKLLPLQEDDLLEAEEIWKEMQKGRDPDEQRELCGRLRRPYQGNPDDTPEEE